MHLETSISETSGQIAQDNSNINFASFNVLCGYTYSSDGKEIMLLISTVENRTLHIGVWVKTLRLGIFKGTILVVNKHMWVYIMVNT